MWIIWLTRSLCPTVFICSTAPAAPAAAAPPPPPPPAAAAAPPAADAKKEFSGLRHAGTVPTWVLNRGSEMPPRLGAVCSVNETENG